MKYSDLLKWAEDKFNELTSQLSEECMICEFVNRGDTNMLMLFGIKNLILNFKKLNKNLEKDIKKHD